MSAHDNILSLHAGAAGIGSRSVPLGGGRAARPRRAAETADARRIRVEEASARRQAMSQRRRGAAEQDRRQRRSAGRSGRAGVALAGAGTFVGRHRVLVATLVAIAVVISVLYAPVRQLYVAHRAHDALSAQLDSVNATNSSLQGEVDSLMTREGIEDEARRLGYVYKGETAVDMAGVDDHSDPKGASGAATEDARLPWYTSALDYIFNYQPDGKAAK